MGFITAQLRPFRFYLLIRFCNRLRLGWLFAKIKLLFSILLGLVRAERAVMSGLFVTLLIVGDIVDAELLTSLLVLVLLALLFRVFCIVVL